MPRRRAIRLESQLHPVLELFAHSHVIDVRRGWRTHSLRAVFALMRTRFPEGVHTIVNAARVGLAPQSCCERTTRDWEGAEVDC
jgi:hypothetical protein